MPSLIKLFKWFLVDQFMFNISVGGGGGGSQQAPSSQTVSNTSIPEYARPYVETMLGQTAALTDINQNPYQTYGGQRIAPFNKQQQTAFSNIENMQKAGQLGTGTDLARQAGYGGIAAAGQVPGLQNQALNYGAAGSMYGSAGADQAMMASQQAQRQAQMYGRQGSQYGAQAAGMAPQAQQYGETAANVGMGGLGYGLQGAMAGQQAAGYGAQGANIGQNVAGMSTDPGAQAAYMSPYIQNALQPQLEEMQRQYRITGAQEQGRATAAGAFGGTRNALMQAENERNKNMAMNQAIGSGYQNAFTAAQNQMNQAAQLGMQGTQQGITGQQAAMQGAGVGLSGIGTAMQGQQAGLAGLGQAGSLYGQGMQGAQTGLSGVGQQIASGQLGLSGAQTGMQGAQTGMQGVQGAVGAGQYGLAGLGTAGSAAGTLGQLGQTEYGQQMGINSAQQTAGAVQQAQAQQALDLAYQDFGAQRNYPYQQLAFQSDMLRGLPLSQSAQTQYNAAPSAASQIGGLGMSALGIYGMSGGFGSVPRAKGGIVNAAQGGLMAAKAYKDGGYATGGDISMMTTQQLTKLLDNKSLTPMEVSMIQKQLMLRRRMEMNPAASQIMAPAVRSGIGAISTGEMVPEEGMAGGGIVAFAQGGPSRDSYQTWLENQVKNSIEKQLGEDAFAKSDAEKAKLETAIADRKERSPWEALAMAGLGTMAGSSQYGLTNLGLGATEGLKSYSKSMGQEASDRQKILEAQMYADKAEDARKTGLTGQMQTTLGQMYNKQAAQAAAGAGSEEKALLRVQALINQDDQLPLLYKQRDMYEPSDAKYKAYNDAINSIKKTYFEQAGIKRPFVAPAAVQLPEEKEKPGFFERVFGGSDSPKNKVVPFSQLPAKG